MKLILILICVYNIQSTKFKTTYQIIFPGGETFSYAKLYGTIDRPLNDFTLCHWSRTNVNPKVGKVNNIFSYWSSLSDNDIVSFITHNRAVHFTRLTGESKVEINILDSEWLHVCNTWSTVAHRWQTFVNGERLGYGNWSTSNYPVRQNGVVVLGQEQDTMGGGFDINVSVIGQVSEVHMWDHILTPREVMQISKCENQEYGNIIDWNHATWALYNGSRISLVRLPCGQPQ